VMLQTPRDRIPYSAIVDRPALTLPGSAQLIVWVIVNVENWDARRPMPRAVLPPPMGGNPLIPDLPNWAWHEYGMRVGFWRVYEALGQRAIVPTFACNGSVCQAYPEVVAAALKAGWEFMGHGYVQTPMHSLEDQRSSIRRTIDAIAASAGRPPRGWESPGLTETFETIDLLAEEGIEYVADWVLDDQPCYVATSAGPVVSLPYTVEMNDVAMMAVAQRPSEEFLSRGKRQFDRLYAESSKIVRIMSVSVHPYLIGVAHRIGYFEELLAYIAGHDNVLFCTGEQIVDWFRGQRPPASATSKW
jgi:allantoinase